MNTVHVFFQEMTIATGGEVTKGQSSCVAEVNLPASETSPLLRTLTLLENRSASQWALKMGRAASPHVRVLIPAWTEEGLFQGLGEPVSGDMLVLNQKDVYVCSSIGSVLKVFDYAKNQFFNVDELDDLGLTQQQVRDALAVAKNPPLQPNVNVLAQLVASCAAIDAFRYHDGCVQRHHKGLIRESVRQHFKLFENEVKVNSGQLSHAATILYDLARQSAITACTRDTDQAHRNAERLFEDAGSLLSIEVINHAITVNLDQHRLIQTNPFEESPLHELLAEVRKSAPTPGSVHPVHVDLPPQLLMGMGR